MYCRAHAISAILHSESAVLHGQLIDTELNDILKVTLIDEWEELKVNLLISHISRKHARIGVVLFMMILLTLTACQSEEKTISSLYAYKSNERSMKIDKETAHAYFEQVYHRVLEGYTDCVYYPVMYSFLDDENTDEYEYFLYIQEQSHGDAFAVSLYVVTAFDGEDELLGLAWVGYELDKFPEIEIINYLLQGEEVVTDDTVAFIYGYQINIPDNLLEKEMLERNGYKESYDGGVFTKTDHIIMTCGSGFCQEEDSEIPN